MKIIPTKLYEIQRTKKKHKDPQIITLSENNIKCVYQYIIKTKNIPFSLN